MKRQLRKQLRIWKNDFDNVWSRLTSFHRAAIGIIIAMIIVVVVRNFVTDPIKSELTKKQAEIKQNSVPSVVLTPDQDNEIQEMKLTIESLKKSLKKEKTAESELITKISPLKKDQKNLAINETGRIISRSGLRVISLSEIPTEENNDYGGMTTSVHKYVIAGSFNEILGFFKKIVEFPWPYLLENISVSTVKENDSNFVEFDELFMLELSFTQTLFYYDYE